MLTYDVDLCGAITGAMWWPTGVQGAVPVRISLNREEGRMSEPTLRDLLDHVLMERGGDFSGSQFTADTRLIVTSRKSGRVHSRTWELLTFPSVRDLINPDVCSYDFADGED